MSQHIPLILAVLFYAYLLVGVGLTALVACGSIRERGFLQPTIADRTITFLMYPFAAFLVLLDGGWRDVSTFTRHAFHIVVYGRYLNEP